MLRQKKILFFSFAFIFSLSAYAKQEHEAPTILLFLGRFHPLLLHLPIGALLLTFFIEIGGRIRKIDNHQLVVSALGFTAFFTFFTAIFGYFLSLEGGYGEEVLQIHMIAGFAMSFFTFLVFLAKRKTSNIGVKMYMPLYIFTLLLTIVTGHYGSVLTHGDDFLTEYSPLKFEEEQKLVMNTDSLYYYQHVIVPIMDDKCIQCHNANKTKGELNLSTPKDILKGGESGEAVIKGNLEESPLHAALMFPIDDDLHMPPSGKPQMTRNEIWLIKHWIETGADFNKQVVSYVKNDTLSFMLNDYLILPKRTVEEASQNQVADLITHGFSMRKLVYNEPFLAATYANNEVPISKKAIQKLAAISNQLIELNLQESKLTDDLASGLKKLKSLRTLRLDQTKITDKSLEYLKGMEKLDNLNLFETEVTKDAVADLLNYIEPRKIYAGNEGNQADELVLVEEDMKQVTISEGLQKGFIEKTKLDKPLIIGDKAIFENETNIEIKSNLKNEKIYYTLDGTDPDSTSLSYTEPIYLNTSTHFKTRTYKENWFPSDIVSRYFSRIKFKIKDLSVVYQPEESYPGIEKMIDLEKGSKNFRDGKWNGYHNDLITTLDMEESVSFSGISVNCLEGVSNYIFYPLDIEVYAGDDMNSMKKIGYLDIPPTDRVRETKIKTFVIEFPELQARYIKLKVSNMKKVPKWHEGANAKAWIFVDEIMVL